MKAVDILVRIDRPDYLRRINGRRQRLLHQDPVDLRILIEPVDARNQLRLGDVGGQPHDPPPDSQPR